jgi:maleylacetate reductase
MVCALREFVYAAPAARVIVSARAHSHTCRARSNCSARARRWCCALRNSRRRRRAGRARARCACGRRVCPGGDARADRDGAGGARSGARLGADCAVAIGGGSTTGLGKAIALDSGLPILAIPTTYAGSEMTPIYGLTEAGLKRTGGTRGAAAHRHLRSELTLSLPIGLTVTSGMNAIAHAAEGLIRRMATPSWLMAEEGIRAMAARCRLLRRDPGTWRPARRRSTARGCAAPCSATSAWAASQALPHAGRQLQSAACRSAHRRAAARHRLQRVRHPGGDGAHEPRIAQRCTPRPRCTIWRATMAPRTRCANLAWRRADLDRAADIAVSNPYWNPRPIERDGNPRPVATTPGGSRPG